MGKLNDRKDLLQRASRSLMAISLAASLAAFGCTTNHNLGNGTPTRSGPDVRTAPTSGVTTGGETYTPPTPPPMTSSYSRPEVLPKVTAKRTIRRDPNAAAAIMAQHQAHRGVYLGATNPGLGATVVNPQSNRVANVASMVNPQATVNSSISSSPTSVINSGADGSSAPAASGTTAAATITGRGVVGTGTLPTVASSRLPTVTAASAPIRVLRSTNGITTVTNVGTSTARSQ